MSAAADNPGSGRRQPRPDPYLYPPRGMDRLEAARYLGIGGTKLDELVARGWLPKP